MIQTLGKLLEARFARLITAMQAVAGLTRREALTALVAHRYEYSEYVCSPRVRAYGGPSAVVHDATTILQRRAPSAAA